MTLILGIDPGSRITGFGVIEQIGSRSRYIDSGCLRTQLTLTVAERLQQIYQGIEQIITRYQPQSAGIEQIFMAKNPDSALKLGQARGVAMVACANAQIPIDDYSARQVKQAVVGYGAADKKQVQAMVCQLLSLNRAPQADAADALAVAICHAHTRTNLVKLAGISGLARQRWRR